MTKQTCDISTSRRQSYATALVPLAYRRTMMVGATHAPSWQLLPPNKSINYA